MYLKRGSNDKAAVSQLKADLIKLGFSLTDVGDAKGVFGPATEGSVKIFQRENDLTPDGIVGPITRAMINKLLEDLGEKTGPTPIKTGKNPENPAYKEAKKYAGKGEHDSVFVKFLAAFWYIVGLRNFKTIIGASFAWCGLFVAAMNMQVGQDWIRNGAGAKNWAKYGVEIDYRKNGAPKGAVVHINHNFNCKSGSGNHVAFLDADCTAEDLTRRGNVIPLFGGNQGNKVKRSLYDNREICEVRWPADVIPFPGKVTESTDCSNLKKTGTESTR